MFGVELAQRANPNDDAIDARTEERHVVAAQPLAVEGMNVLRRAVLVRELKVPGEQGTYVRCHRVIRGDGQVRHAAIVVWLRIVAVRRLAR